MGLSLSEIMMFALAPATFVTAALKIRLTWLDLPFSRRNQPLLFWIDLVCAFAFFAVSLGLLWRGDPPWMRFSLLFTATLLAINAGQIVLTPQRSAQPSKYEFASARDDNGGFLIWAIVLWCFAAAIGVWACSELVRGAR